MRKHYIDNLRNMTILLLFPVHTFMIWNDFGSRFYIWQGENRLLSTLIVLVNPWFMPLLFVIAGMSARYALEKRSGKDYVIQRVHKLLIPYGKVAQRAEKLPVLGLVLLFVPVWLMYYLGNFGGFSLGKNLALFLAGYYFLSHDAVLDRLERNMKWLAALWAVCTVFSVVLYYRYSYYGDLWVNFIGWISILVLLVSGRKYLDKRTGFTAYFNRASYPLYILHQSILVALAYYVVGICDTLWMQVFCICLGSFALTVAAYHLIRRVPVANTLVGIR